MRPGTRVRVSYLLGDEPASSRTYEGNSEEEFVLKGGEVGIVADTPCLVFGHANVDFPERPSSPCTVDLKWLVPDPRGVCAECEQDASPNDYLCEDCRAS